MLNLPRQYAVLLGSVSSHTGLAIAYWFLQALYSGGFRIEMA